MCPKDRAIRIQHSHSGSTDKQRRKWEAWPRTDEDPGPRDNTGKQKTITKKIEKKTDVIAARSATA
jgi:hypothetical protein